MWGGKKSANKRIDSLVGKNTKVLGDVDFTGGLLVDGQVIGNITAQADENASITISENGRVQGEINIANVIINGTVEGNVHATNHVELAKKARVFGNVYYHLFEMSMGAEVNGNLVHVSEEQLSIQLENSSIESEKSPAQLTETTETAEQ